jgi:hypothetical protein
MVRTLCSVCCDMLFSSNSCPHPLQTTTSPSNKRRLSASVALQSVADISIRPAGLVLVIRPYLPSVLSPQSCPRVSIAHVFFYDPRPSVGLLLLLLISLVVLLSQSVAAPVSVLSHCLCHLIVDSLHVTTLGAFVSDPVCPTVFVRHSNSKSGHVNSKE